VTDEEGTDYAAIFAENLANGAAQLDERIGNERLANRTPKQRARRAKKTTMVSFRCADPTKQIADAIAQKHNISLTDVLERAILKLAEIERIRVPA
jgi:hypothetical protein